MTTRSTSLGHVHVARRLLDAMGLGTALLAVPLASCGGLAVVEHGAPNEGAGGAGATTTAVSVTSSTAVSVTNGTAVTSTGTGFFACDPPLTEVQELQYACLDDEVPSPCPLAPSPELTGMLGPQLDTWEPVDEFCTKGRYVVDVPCGPDPTTESGCCYYAVMETSTLCEGRPFTVDGVARVAGTRTRSDWLAAVAPDTAHLTADERRDLARAYARDAQHEHASVASFARFAMELLATAAPAGLVADAQQAMGDEIRHAALCFGLASAYAGAPVGPSRLAIDLSLARSTDAVDIAVRAAREGCVGETLSALAVLAARDAATDPAVVAALDAIAADELAHAELAWRYLVWALREGDEALRGAVRAAFDDELRDGPLAGDSPDDAHAPRLRQHGQLSDGEKRRVMAQGLREVVRPCALALLAAHEAAPAITACIEARGS